MLEFSNFQIFMMVLHGCLLLFAFAFLFGGNTSKKSNKIVSYREFQKQKNRKQARRKVASQQHARKVREVRDVSEVMDMAAGAENYMRQARIPQPQRQPTRLITAGRTSTDDDTITHFSLDTLLDIDID